jgi:cytochrome d ubiquinol oxidase subunit II
MLIPDAAPRRRERSVLINTIGRSGTATRCGAVAGGATFAAFPEWYAPCSAASYLPLLVILRRADRRAGVAFEYRGKRDRDRSWQRRWDAAIVVGSFVRRCCGASSFANIVRGVAIDADKEYVGSVFDLLNPYGLLGGLTTLGSASPTARCSCR